MTCSEPFAFFLAFALLIAAGAALADEIKPYRARGPRQRRRAARRDLAQGDGADRRENQGQERRAIAQGRRHRRRRRQFQGRERAPRRGDRRRAEGRRVVAGARQARRAGATTRKADGRYDFVQRGQTAAYAAYQRASGAAAAGRGARRARRPVRPPRDAGAPRSTPIAPASTGATTRTSRKIYEDLREKHGFRILDYKVDNESASPRVCFNFSEPLARKTDFAPYVAVAGAANAAISSEDQQICVEGLKHGERYAIVLRAGPALGGRRIAAEVGRLRDLRARPLAAGAFRRQGLCAAARRASSARR